MRLVLLGLVLLLAACQNSADHSLAASDSLVIRFVDTSGSGGDKTISTVNKTAIKKLAGYLDGEALNQLECGIDGRLLFYKAGQLTDSVFFNYSDESCRHFIHMNGTNTQPVRLNNEAGAFLQGLAEGRSWY